MHKRPAADGALEVTTGQEVASSIPPATPIESDRSPLRQAIDDAIAEANGTRLSLKDLTVLSPQIDPFRLDTAARHRDGQWLAQTARELGVLSGERKIHLRGLHYATWMAPTPYMKPDGTRYMNTDEDWNWLCDAAKAARFLGYVDFDRIFDNRNLRTVVRIFNHKDPWPFVNVGLEVDIPDADAIEPHVGVLDFVGAQAYKIVMIGEKSSLEEGLASVAEAHGADLYLPSGEISDTLVHQIAKHGAEDGRPLLILYFSDADPAGWQMPISVARKLQAFKACLYPDLEFEVHRVAVTPDQVREYGLPSAPMKDSERRGDRWREAMGVDQTEIDALTTPQMLPVLRRIAEAAIAPYFDYTLAQRVDDAKRQWEENAQSALDAQVDGPHLDRLREDAAQKLAALREEIDAINAALRVDVGDDFDLPPVPPVPGPILDGVQPLPLLDSRLPFAEQCKRLIDSKAYRLGGGS